jgi:hypothetical protein
MFDISCIESFNFYHNKTDKNKNCDSLKELKGLIIKKKEETLKKIKETIFEKCKEEYKTITYEDLYILFKDFYNEGV